jgi:hypothetical protein
MQRLEVSGAVRPIYGSFDVKRLKEIHALKVLQNGMLSVLERESEKVTRGWRKVPSEFSIICFVTKQH